MTDTNEYALWAHIANAAAQKKIKPELIVVENDKEFQELINQRVEEERQQGFLKDNLNTQFFSGRPVIGKILILPRSAAREFVYEKPWACISIASHPSELPKLNKVQQVALLQQTFEDLDGCSEKFAQAFPEKAANLFTANHARQILNFVAEWWNHIDLLMIHCYAGSSRSPAVGKAISDIYQPELSHYFDAMFSPNRLVYETLKDVYHNEFDHKE